MGQPYSASSRRKAYDDMTEEEIRKDMQFRNRVKDKLPVLKSKSKKKRKNNSAKTKHVAAPPATRPIFSDKRTAAIFYSEQLKHKATKSELSLCRLLDDKGIKYEFQYVFMTETSFFLVDFYFPDKGLVIELDGSIHIGQEAKDADRTRILNLLYNVNVVRFWNNSVKKYPQDILYVIEKGVRPTPINPFLLPADEVEFDDDFDFPSHPNIIAEEVMVLMSELEQKFFQYFKRWIPIT